MKANEIPEKIYVSNYSSGLTYNWHDERLAVNDIEYTHTDAFIKKACAYIKEHLFDYWSQSVTNESKFIEDFVNYMKGE